MPDRDGRSDGSPATGSVTLADVAELAKVSTATVNRVLKGGGYVSQDARERVNEAVRQTGYLPNIMARGLRMSRSFTLAHIVTAITGNPFFANVARGFEAAALQSGYSTIMFNHGDDSTREMGAVRSFLQRRVDAITFNHATDPEAVHAAMQAGVAVVEIERATTADAPFVRVDNLVGSLEAMRHLVDLGHRRIAFVGGDSRLFPADPLRRRSVEDDRLEGYVRTLREQGIPVEDALLRFGRYTSDDPRGTGTDGYRLACELLEAPDRPTAIFATCDILAAGVLQALYEAGLRVPQDVSVIGFDDTLAANLTPQLTTVAQPMAELGEAAFRRVQATIEGRPALQETLLRSRLVIRGSTAAPRGVPASQRR